MFYDQIVSKLKGISYNALVTVERNLLKNNVNIPEYFRSNLSTLIYNYYNTFEINLN